MTKPKKLQVHVSLAALPLGIFTVPEVAAAISESRLVPRQGERISLLSPKGTLLRKECSGEEDRYCIEPSVLVETVIWIPEENAVSITCHATEDIVERIDKLSDMT